VQNLIHLWSPHLLIGDYKTLNIHLDCLYFVYAVSRELFVWHIIPKNIDNLDRLTIKEYLFTIMSCWTNKKFVSVHKADFDHFSVWPPAHEIYQPLYDIEKFQKAQVI
jgi:hypothetical protein